MVFSEVGKRTIEIHLRNVILDPILFQSSMDEFVLSHTSDVQTDKLIVLLQCMQSKIFFLVGIGLEDKSTYYQNMTVACDMIVVTRNTTKAFG